MVALPLDAALASLAAALLGGAALGLRAFARRRAPDDDSTFADVGVDGLDDLDSLDRALPSLGGAPRALSSPADLATFVDALTGHGEAWAVVVLRLPPGEGRDALDRLAAASAEAPAQVVVHAPLASDALGLLARPGDLEVLAPALLRHFEAALGGAPGRLRAGIALAPHDGATGREVVEHAFAASRGITGGLAWHDRGVLDALRERDALKRELRRALADAEIVAHYQAIAEARSLGIVGAEVLVRWAHPVHGLLAPARFLPLVEDQGAMLDLTGRVLGKASRRVKEWRASIHPSFTLVVNASGTQLKDQWMARLVQHVVDRSGVPADALCFEIGFADVRGRDAAVLRTMERLAWIGVRQVIDGVGTCDELRAVADLPIEAVKLDARRLGLAGDGFLGRRAHEIGDVAQERGFAVHAKRVETVGQLAALRAVPAVTRLQGFALAPPMQRSGFAALAGRPTPFESVVGPGSGDASQGTDGR